MKEKSLGILVKEMEAQMQAQLDYLNIKKRIKKNKQEILKFDKQKFDQLRSENTWIVIGLLKLAFKNTLKWSTIDGVPHLITTESIGLKVIWIACLLASFAGCIGVLTLSFRDYFKYDVVSKLQTITEVPTLFRKQKF